ncbi:TVP38/TMEM64 family protein [Fictibacillus phosphorivorans]|uniref:TVP38/TMEM64 family protein n=1 Tax=Fictibacillus phosphorivorans TaxID=1221500 RepID=UPI00203A4C1E|nr:TVP38/TMEM64 family protein [Fictibacillus phosphorivorans]MCM3718303.1 TVP38/TMEM64 family protein [Fictibacillus phosphorivorans]MCM3775833.1 TVP38/TMEM64 family protein [Fictibacillus phosphorivorans]
MKKKTWVKVTVLFVAVILLLALNHFVFKLTPLSLRDWVLSYGMVAPVIYVFINVIRPFTLFPITVLSVAGGLAFGVFWGTVYTVFSSTLGAVISFYVAKHLGARWLKRTTDAPSKIEKWQRQLKEKGFFYIFLLRIIPILNFDLVSYVAGVSRLRLRSYIFATILGVLPGTLASNLLGDSFIKGNGTFIGIAVCLVILAASIPIFMKNKSLVPGQIPIRKEDNA